MTHDSQQGFEFPWLNFCCCEPLHYNINQWKYQLILVSLKFKSFQSLSDTNMVMFNTFDTLFKLHYVWWRACVTELAVKSNSES